MGNIDRNLEITKKLAQRITNSNSKQAPDFKSMMDEITGSRTEEFGVNIVEDAAGTTRALAISEGGIELGGLGICGWIAIIVAALFVIGLLLNSFLPLVRTVSPDTVRGAPSEEALRELSDQQKARPESAIQLNRSQEFNKAIVERGGAVPGMIPDGRQSLVPDSTQKRSSENESRESKPTANAVAPIDEVAMQAERLQSIGNITKYNRLIEEHRKIYRDHGIDPCTSGFFPQGCQ
jgi:hypothetical protein